MIKIEKLKKLLSVYQRKNKINKIKNNIKVK